MLSYRHSFHAGNFADVLKHIVLVEILEHLRKKNKSFDYIDTHSGAGLFNLSSAHATKLNEYSNGIGKLNSHDWPQLTRYFDAIKIHNAPLSLQNYPGSPLIAAHFLRPQDKAWLYELHPADYELLKNNTASNRHIRVTQEDGFSGMLSLLPPASRRGLVLIDPPYEIKNDYETVFATVAKAHQKFATGIYAIWYPVVDRQRITRLEQRFKNSGINNIQRFELALSADSDTRGMTATGMIVINPPWTLMANMSELLPKLLTTLADSDEAFYRCDTLVAE